MPGCRKVQYFPEHALVFVTDCRCAALTILADKAPYWPLASRTVFASKRLFSTLDADLVCLGCGALLDRGKLRGCVYCYVGLGENTRIIACWGRLRLHPDACLARPLAGC